MAKSKTPSPKPRLIASLGSTPFLLFRAPGCKSHYIPATFEQQAKYLPSGSTAKEALQELPWGVDSVELGKHKRKHTRKHKHGRKQRRAHKKAHKKQLSRACRTLCEAPDMLPDKKPGWLVVLICLLASLMDLAVQHLPGSPVIHIKNVSLLPDPLKAILKATHGPTALTGRGAHVKRPYYVQAVVPIGAVAPSVDPEDYFGGYAKVCGKKRFFWLSLRNEAVAIAANVPQAAWKNVIEQSPLAVPMFYSTKPKLPNRTVLEMDGTAFESYDPDMLKALGKQSKHIAIVLERFDHWLRQKPKRWKQCVKDAGTFYPRSRNGRFVTTNASDEIRVIALTLAIFKKFLLYATDEKWLSSDVAREIFLEAWNQLIPESSPNSASRNEDPSASWDSPDVFWSFLKRYLQENQQTISLSGAPCKQGTTAVVHNLPDGNFLILPREQFVQAYADDLTRMEATLPEKKNRWGVSLQKAILDWGVKLKTEGKDTTWRFSFYKEGEVDVHKLPCLAFPLSQLPETITESLRNWFGSEFEAMISPSEGRNKTEL